MPIILAGFILLPLVLGLVIEYLVCRFTWRRPWKLLPPAAGIAAALIIAVGRARIWSSQSASPWTQLLIFPILPTVFLLLGFFLGWRLHRRMWGPRVVNDKRRWK